MDALTIGWMACALVLLAGAGNVAALGAVDPAVAGGGAAVVATCTGLGGVAGDCIGVYEDHGQIVCIGISDGSRCIGVQV